MKFNSENMNMNVLGRRIEYRFYQNEIESRFNIRRFLPKTHCCGGNRMDFLMTGIVRRNHYPQRQRATSVRDCLLLRWAIRKRTSAVQRLQIS